MTVYDYDNFNCSFNSTQSYSINQAQLSFIIESCNNTITCDGGDWLPESYGDDIVYKCSNTPEYTPPAGNETNSSTPSPTPSYSPSPSPTPPISCNSTESKIIIIIIFVYKYCY